jgi:hypothetical protein
MEVKIELRGAASVAWLKSVLDGYETARAADQVEEDQRWRESNPFGNVSETGEVLSTSAEAPVEAEKPKSTRTRKKAEEPAPEQAQITTSPEDRKPADSTPVEEIEEAEVVAETAPEVDVFEDVPAPKVYTRDDVKAAMQVYVAKHGMDALAANAQTLLGAPKLSGIPEDAAAFEAAVKRLEAAVA